MTPFILAIAIASASSPVDRSPQAPSAFNETGPRKVAVNLPYGAISVYLPLHLKPGGRISGSVFAAPNGMDWTTQHQQISALDALTLRIGDQKLRVDQVMFSLEIPMNEASLPMDIEDAAGTVLGQYSLSLQTGNDAFSDQLTTSSVVQSGAPVEVLGKFDGDRTHTLASINGRPMGVLAQSGDECYITAPVERQGSVRLRVQASGQTLDKKIYLVGFHFMAPSHAVRSGRQSSVAVELDGLQEADSSVFPVTIELWTDSPEIVRFAGPDPVRFTLQVMQADVSGGHVLKSVPIKAASAGRYNINAKIYSSGH